MPSFNVFILLYIEVDTTTNKLIKNFERYIIDDKGTIFDTKKNREICQWIDTVGYYQCNLWDNGKKYYRRVHRLVAEAFIPNPNNLPQVNHRDGNKLNNHYSNLEWCSNSVNTQHGYDNGLYKYKERSHSINVYTKQGIYINTYKSIRSMCEELKINRKTVTMILKGEKKTNNYDYLFEYVKEGQETIESIA